MAGAHTGPGAIPGTAADARRAFVKDASVKITEQATATTRLQDLSGRIAVVPTTGLVVLY